LGEEEDDDGEDDEDEDDKDDDDSDAVAVLSAAASAEWLSMQLLNHADAICSTDSTSQLPSSAADALGVEDGEEEKEEEPED
jgi:hypothetical protein